MNTSASRLSPLFRSDIQADLLARLLLNPEVGFTISELARLTGAAYATAHRELQRLIEMGLITQRQVGRAVVVQANQSDQVFAPVAELVRMSHGPAVVVSDVLSPISGIRQAFIYGSWAARRAGEAGTPPGDIDVMVIGDPSRREIADAAALAEARLGREVNIRIVSEAAWSMGSELFIKTVKERPMVKLDVGDGA